MITRTDDWVPMAERLADDLAARDELHDPAWRAALTAVPRHLLVPRFARQRSDASWAEITDTDPGYLAEVYSNKPLVTALTAEGAGPQPASSSSKPGLMIRMLEALKLDDGQRVLEIGTGTGYNAGLLAHRLGDRNVYSVDVDPVLVDTARGRLADLGYHPALAVVDGAGGWPEHAPYDKIIATCSVPTIPWAWGEQTVLGGQVLVDVKIGQGAGNLALLDRHADRLEGRFLPGWAGFMSIRTPGVAPPAAAGPGTDAATIRPTSVGPRPWTNLVAWFFAAFGLPAGFGYGVIFEPGNQRPEGSFLTAPDGSWCTVSPDTDGGYRVQEAGPTELWRHVEDAYTLWRDLDEPDWPRLGLTVRDGGTQKVWLDDPQGTVSWPLVA